MPDNITTSDPIAEVAERALKKTSVITLSGWSATDERYLFVAPYDCTIDQVWLVSDIAVAANDTSYYSFQVQNLTAAAALLSSAQTTQATGGTAITGDTPYAVNPNQNATILNGAVLELQITGTGTPTTLATAEIVGVVEYT